MINNKQNENMRTQSKPLVDYPRSFWETEKGRGTHTPHSAGIVNRWFSFSSLFIFLKYNKQVVTKTISIDSRVNGGCYGSRPGELASMLMSCFTELEVALGETPLRHQLLNTAQHGTVQQLSPRDRLKVKDREQKKVKGMKVDA